MKVRGIFKFFQKFKLFFHENHVLNFFVANFRGTFEPYVVVMIGGIVLSLCKVRVGGWGGWGWGKLLNLVAIIVKIIK